MPPEKVEQMLAEGRMRLHFVIKLYRIQLDAGRQILHEHPAGALSWRDDRMVKLLKDYGVDTVTPHQYEYGLLTPGPGVYQPLQRSPHAGHPARRSC